MHGLVVLKSLENRKYIAEHFADFALKYTQKISPMFRWNYGLKNSYKFIICGITTLLFT